MLEILKAIIFGIVEGVTEWLPISSTGHLILLNEVVNLKVSSDPVVNGAFLEMFNVVIQLGAILAVVLLFFHKLNPFSPKKSREQKKDTWVLWMKVVVAIVPSGILGVLLDDWMDAHFFNSVVVSIALIGYGVAFIYIEKMRQGKPALVQKVRDIDLRTALLIGAFQCLSLIPGTSRSGSTILGGILLGVGRAAAAEFSFFMAIPTMFGASAVKLLGFVKSGASLTGLGVGVLIVGCTVSFLVSLVVIRVLMNYVRKRSFSAFGVYRIALGAVILCYFGIKMLVVQ